MITRKAVTSVILSFSVLLQGTSILHYYFNSNELYFFNWSRQYTVLVAVSIIFTFIQYLLNRSSVVPFLFILRFIFLLIIYIPTVIYVNLKQLFLLAFLLDIIYLNSFPLNIILSGLSFITIFTSSLMNQKWTGSFCYPNKADITYLLIYTFISFIIFFLLKMFTDKFFENNSKIFQFNQTIKKLTDANNGFQNYIQIIEKKSTENERNRIIREIHDSIGYTLTTIMMQATSALESEKNQPNSNITEILHNIDTYARTGLNDMRIVLRILKDKKEKKSSDIEEIRKVIKAFEEATNVKVNLELGNIPLNFDQEISHVIFRVIQEGMINALRHGMASVIDIYFFRSEKDIIITIQDNGKGFKHLSSGIGLKGINERLEKVSGSYNIYSNSNGTSLRITIPVENNE